MEKPKRDRSAEYARRKRSPSYLTWSGMIQRCNNPKHDKYPYYGGRGIKVCKRWREFRFFLKDMGERPDGLTLDRKDPNKNYCKENCKWATKSEQSRNRRPWKRKPRENTREEIEMREAVSEAHNINI